MRGKPAGINPGSGTIQGQKLIHPFMEFSMAVGERKGTGIAMVDSWTVIDVAAVGDIFKVAIVNRGRIFIQENKAVGAA